MIRPLRQIDDQAEILADPDAHTPDRPWWRCAVDGQDWPCGPLRAHLLATMPVQAVGIAMSPRYKEAIRELDKPAAEVWRQMLGWIRAAR